jgi:hypothetical protein
MDLRDDYGCFFVTLKDTHQVGYIIYIKTNYLAKHHPEIKLNYFDFDKELFLTKPHQRNKIWLTMFYQNGRDGPAMEDITEPEFKRFIRKSAEVIYNSKDYPTSEELYTTMKKSKPGLPSNITKKWFEDQYAFIEGQYAFINNKKRLPSRRVTKHNRNGKTIARRTRRKRTLRRQPH